MVASPKNASSLYGDRTVDTAQHKTSASAAQSVKVMLSKNEFFGLLFSAEFAWVKSSKTSAIAAIAVITKKK